MGVAQGSFFCGWMVSPACLPRDVRPCANCPPPSPCSDLPVFVLYSSRATLQLARAPRDHVPTLLPTCDVLLCPRVFFFWQSSELRSARTEGRLVCLNIIDECTGEAVEEAAKGCIREVSDFVAGEPSRAKLNHGSVSRFRCRVFAPALVTSFGVAIYFLIRLL